MLKRIQEPEAWEPQINQVAFEALDMAIEALSQESSEDVISRQAAIDALKNRWKKTRNYEGIGDDIAEECELYLKQLPSAQPTAEPVRHGKWIRVSPAKIYECSECGQNVCTGDIECYRFCHQCGARMDGDRDVSTKRL